MVQRQGVGNQRRYKTKDSHNCQKLRILGRILRYKCTKGDSRNNYQRCANTEGDKIG